MEEKKKKKSENKLNEMQNFTSIDGNVEEKEDEEEVKILAKKKKHRCMRNIII